MAHGIALALMLLVAVVPLRDLPANAAPPPAASPPPPPTRPFPFAIPRAALKTNVQSAYLSIILDMQARETEAMADPMLQTAYLDVLPWYLVAVGEHAAAADMEVRFRKAINHPVHTRSDKAPFADDVRALSAAAAIVEAAKDRRIVMFNEEHRSSVQRAFMNEVIDGLAAAGFTHFCLESVSSSQDDGINARGYPVLATGVYTLDPALADAIRRARAAGLTIASYDYDHPDIPPLAPEDFGNPDLRENHREANAARHLQDILDADPDARLIVYAGRGHIFEKPAGDWNTMSARLKQATGIDPLTVELTHMVEFNDRVYEHPAYHHATARALVAAEPVVLQNPDGSFWTEFPGGYDISVFHPRTRWEHGRPHYLQMGGHRRPVTEDVDRETFAGPLLLQARVPGESADAVPMDQVILWPGKPTPALLLPPGRYTVHIIDRDNRELHAAEARVAADPS